MNRKSSAEAGNTIIAVDASFEGDFHFTGTARIEGKIKGNIKSPDGFVVIGEKAEIEGEISVGTAVIYGGVKGSVDADKRIEIYPPGKIDGNICAPVISIDTGVVFNGHCEMTARTIASGSKKIFKRPKGQSNIKSFPKTG